MLRPAWQQAGRTEERTEMELTDLLQQAESQCQAQGATLAPESVEAQRLRRADIAIGKALDLLAGKYDDEIRAQRDRSQRNIAAFEALQRVTGQRGMVFLPNHAYAEDLHDYCARQGIVAPPLPALGGYEQ